MKIDYVIMGSDSNPMYLDFWPIVSKVWKEKFNIVPVLGLICDEDSEMYSDEYGIIKKFKKIDNVDVGLQSQIVRLFLPKFLNGSCLISDIDMMPLSVDYFNKNSEELNYENIVIYSSDNPECLREKMYPMCYILSHSEVFKKIFKLDVDWTFFTEELKNRNQGWYTDQKFIYEKINDYHSENKNCVFLNRGWNGVADNRIDRINWNYDIEKLKMGYYIDSHLLRPYKRYETEINNLVNIIL
jgi:hypothetical protein